MTASSTAGVRLIDCTEAGHSAEILAILNDAILHSTAIYDYAPRPAEAMIDWFAAKRAGIRSWARSMRKAACWGSPPGAPFVPMPPTSTPSSTASMFIPKNGAGAWAACCCAP